MGFSGPGGSGEYCCGEMFSGSSNTILSAVLWSPHPCSHPEKGLWHCSHGRDSQKSPSALGREGNAQPRPRVGKPWLETRSQEKGVRQPGFSSAFGEWWQITAVSNPVQRQQQPWAPQSQDRQRWWCLQKLSENLTLSSFFPRWGKAPREARGKELQATHGAIGHASKQTCLFFFEESMVKPLGCQPHWLKKMKNKFLIFKPCLGSKQHPRVPGTASLCRQGNCCSSLHLTFGCDDPYPYPPANTALSRLFFSTPVWQVFHFILILSWTKFISKKKINPNGSQKGFWVSINWHVSIFAKRKTSLDSQKRIWCKFGVKQRSFYLLIICMHVLVGRKFGVRRSKAHLCVCRTQCSVRTTFRYLIALIILWYQIRNNFYSLSIIFSWHFWEKKKRL